MFARLAAALAATFLVLAASGARADMMFGTQEDIHFIQDVDITSQDNEPLFLGYKTSTRFIVAGVYIKDDGYVFGIRSDHSKYIETSPDEIAKFQASGLLPNPLPPYKISTMDYVIGYSLWILLPIVILGYVIAWLVRRRRAAAAPADAPPA